MRNRQKETTQKFGTTHVQVWDTHTHTPRDDFLSCKTRNCAAPHSSEKRQGFKPGRQQPLKSRWVRLQDLPANRNWKGKAVFLAIFCMDTVLLWCMDSGHFSDPVSVPELSLWYAMIYMILVKVKCRLKLLFLQFICQCAFDKAVLFNLIRVVHFTTDAVNRHLMVRRNLRFWPSEIELQA